MKLSTAKLLPFEYNRGYLAALFGRIDNAVNALAPPMAVTKTASFSLEEGKNRIICNGTGAITITLPKASTYTGPPVHLRTIAAFTVVSASANVVPLAGGAAGTAILAATAGKWATLVTDGTNWTIAEAN